MNDVKREDMNSQSMYQKSTIRMGQISKYRNEKLEDFWVFFSDIIAKIWSVEDAARLTVGKEFRQKSDADWAEMSVQTLQEILKSAFDSAAEEPLEIETEDQVDVSSLVKQQWCRDFIGRLKTLVKNNFCRVLTMRCRRLLNVKQKKCRPIYFLLKALLGRAGGWEKGTVFNLIFAANVCRQ